MITENLFEQVLLEPVNAGADELYIISGYATAAMAFHHIQAVRERERRIKVFLLVGMCPNDGLSLSNHKAFQQLCQSDLPDNFECSYVVKPPSVHSKVYSWCKDGEPLLAFAGSANYTQNAFRSMQREVMTGSDPEESQQYFNSLIPDSLYCTHAEAESFVRVENDRDYFRRMRQAPEEKTEEFEGALPGEYAGLESLRLDFLEKGGSLPQRSGLNWGKRPEHRRNPDQAYIPVRSPMNRSGFFPQRRVHFTVLTDDHKVLICSRAQDDGKAIHTPHNNSLIGEYFRNRLGVPSGQAISKDDLIRYGRTDVEFFKIDDETYYMDFSVE